MVLLVHEMSLSARAFIHSYQFNHTMYIHTSRLNLIVSVHTEFFLERVSVIHDTRPEPKRERLRREIVRVFGEIVRLCDTAIKDWRTHQVRFVLHQPICLRHPTESYRLVQQRHVLNTHHRFDSRGKCVVHLCRCSNKSRFAPRTSPRPEDEHLVTQCCTCRPRDLETFLYVLD